MLGLTTTKKYDQLAAEVEKLQTEVKGYYDGDNTENAMLRAYRNMLRGGELAPFLPMSRDQIKECYETNGCLYGVVHKIAHATGEVSKYLEMFDRKSGEVITDHWVLDLINRPNDRYNTRAKYVEAWATNKSLYADAWQYAPMTAGKERICTEMYIIPSGDVIPQRGGWMNPLEGIKIKCDPERALIPVADIVMSYDYALDAASFFGTSKAVAAAKYLSVIQRGINRQDTALLNGGAANIITPESTDIGVKPSDAVDIEKKINGRDSFNKTLALRTPVKVQKLTSNPTDLAIMESHKEAITVLCFVYELPVDLVYGQSKYENAKEAKKAIYETNAIPLAEEFGNDILAHFGLSDQFEFRVNTDEISVLQDAPGDVLDNLAKMHASVNEMRTAYGYEPIEEAYADQPMLPIGVMFGNETAIDINEE